MPPIKGSRCQSDFFRKSDQPPTEPGRGEPREGTGKMRNLSLSLKCTPTLKVSISRAPNIPAGILVTVGCKAPGVVSGAAGSGRQVGNGLGMWAGGREL